MAQLVKNPPAVQEMQIVSLGSEDPLEKGMATHSSILVWRIPRTEEPGGLQPRGRKESDATERLAQSSFLLCSQRGSIFKLIFTGPGRTVRPFTCSRTTSFLVVPAEGQEWL